MNSPESGVYGSYTAGVKSAEFEKPILVVLGPGTRVRVTVEEAVVGLSLFRRTRNPPTGGIGG